MSAPEPPPRVRVTSERATASRRTPTTATTEIDTQSEIGTIYVRSLLRAQLRLAMGVLAVLVATIGGLPLLFWLWPAFSDHHVAGVPVSWAILAFAVYPLLLLLGWIFVRGAERNERAFSDVVDES